MNILTVLLPLMVVIGNVSAFPEQNKDADRDESSTKASKSLKNIRNEWKANAVNKNDATSEQQWDLNAQKYKQMETLDRTRPAVTNSAHKLYKLKSTRDPLRMAGRLRKRLPQVPTPKPKRKHPMKVVPAFPNKSNPRRRKLSQG